MTIEEKLVEMLVNDGMFDTQANQVMERVKADKVNESMEKRWHDTTDGYPEVLFKALWISVKYHALAWIDENLPQAWFRPMFVSD